MAFITIVLFLVSLIFIWKGSGWMSDSLVPLAHKLGTHYIAVTTLVVSFLLSIPEIISSVNASLLGHVELGLGVIIGSLMANVGLTVGISAAMQPLTVDKSSVIRDGFFMVIISVVVLLFGYDLQYTRTEGVVLLLLFLPYAGNVWYFEKWRPHHHRKRHVANAKKSLSLIGDFTGFKLKRSIWTFFLGGGVLIIGSYIFSTSLIDIASLIPLPEILIGLTAGAIGPALPNIVAAIQGTRKGFTDAAITETFGSNIFTLMITLGLIIIINPFSIIPKVFYFDLTWMIIMHLLLIMLILKGYHYREESVTRYEGWMLIAFYIGLILVNVLFF